MFFCFLFVHIFFSVIFLFQNFRKLFPNASNESKINEHLKKDSGFYVRFSDEVKHSSDEPRLASPTRGVPRTRLVRTISSIDGACNMFILYPLI